MSRLMPPMLFRRTAGKRLLQQRIAVLECEGDALRGTVEEHARTVLAREAAIVGCEAVVRVREQTINECEDTIRRYEGVIGDLRAALQQREQTTADMMPAGADPGDARGDRFLENSPKRGTPAVADRRLSPTEADSWLDAWRQVAAKYADVVLSKGQTLIEPYLVERIIHDRIGRVIIGTVEGRNWYDNNNTIELPHLLRLGMIREGDTVFDCGANQGVNALFYARAVGATGRVLAFDPFALNIDIGHFNARLNDAGNIDFIQAGLSDQAGRAVVSLAEQSTGLVNETAADAVPINLVPLDMFAALRPSFLKIDVEGAEVNALEGARDVVAQEPAIYIEVHPHYLPRFDRSPMDIFKHISLDRYTCYIDHPNVPLFAEYRGEFEMTEGCALYCVPKSRPSLTRHFGSSRQSGRQP
jgi:FkbM family methyltransferase